ncbi:MAG: hypothetical protein RLP45_16315 [Haliea sp.]
MRAADRLVPVTSAFAMPVLTFGYVFHRRGMYLNDSGSAKQEPRGTNPAYTAD